MYLLHVVHSHAHTSTYITFNWSYTQLLHCVQFLYRYYIYSVLFVNIVIMLYELVYLVKFSQFFWKCLTLQIHDHLRPSAAVDILPTLASGTLTGQIVIIGEHLKLNKHVIAISVSSKHHGFLILKQSGVNRKSFVTSVIIPTSTHSVPVWCPFTTYLEKLPRHYNIFRSRLAMAMILLLYDSLTALY